MPENPFLVPPPPRREPDGGERKSAPPADEPAPQASETIGPPPMIALPPGLVDSATLKIAAERASNRIVAPATSPTGPPEKNEVVFFPAPPGQAPSRPGRSDPREASWTRTAAKPGAEPATTDAAATVIRPDRVARAWRITLPDGRTVDLPRRLLLGRNPAASGAWADAELLPLVDPGKSVSKTHAALEIHDDELLVSDLDSTNGVWVATPGGDAREVRPGERVTVPPGSDLELGGFVVRIERSDIRPPLG